MKNFLKILASSCHLARQISLISGGFFGGKGGKYQGDHTVGNSKEIKHSQPCAKPRLDLTSPHKLTASSRKHFSQPESKIEIKSWY